MSIAIEKDNGPAIAFRRNAIDSAAIASAIQIEVLLNHRWQTSRMLNHLAINVYYIQSSIRSICKLSRTKPVVLRSHKLTLLVHSPGLKLHVARHGQVSTQFEALRKILVPIKVWLLAVD